MGDGSLYLPDDVLAELDWVVASLHVAQRQDADRITKRLLAAAEHPCVDVIGHPSGRLIGKRDGYDFDVEALVAAVRRARHVPRDQLRSRTGSTCAPRTRGSRSHAGVKLVISTDAHRLARARLPGARRLHGAARRRDARTTSPTRARWPSSTALRKPGRVGADVSEPDRSSEGLVFVSTGRRLAAAKVGRRWHEVRGPLLIAAALASIQALLLFVVLRMLQDSGHLAALVRAHRRAHDARARRLDGARARRLRPGRAARPGARGGDPRDARGRARRPARRLRRAPARRSSPTRSRERLGYARRRPSATASACSRTSGSAPTTTAPACPRRPAPSTR